jgi:hypothetical protein
MFIYFDLLEAILDKLNLQIMRGIFSVLWRRLRNIVPPFIQE